MVFYANRLYFDEAAVGISSGITSDANHHFDSEENNLLSITSNWGLGKDQYVARETLGLVINFSSDIIDLYSNYIDLLQLVPEKFQSSLLLQQLLYTFGIESGIWLSQIRDLQDLLNVNTVSEDYIQNLADLIGLVIQSDSTTTLAEKRKQLIETISWYKMKGTYKSLRYIGYLLDMSLQIWDMYTKDYENFTASEWFVGDSDADNPPNIGGVDNHTELLLHFDGSHNSTVFTDSSLSPHTVTPVSGAVISTVASKFGGASGYFSGAGYLISAVSASWYFAAGDFSSSFRVYFESLTTLQGFISQVYNETNYWAMYKNSASSGNKLQMTFVYGGLTKADYIMAGNWTPSLYTWYEIEYGRKGGEGFIFIDGISQNLTVLNPFESNDVGNVNESLNIANFSGDKLYGYLDELKIDKGICRHTTNYSSENVAYALSSAYYKSPHIGISIILDKEYGSGSSGYLFKESQYTNLQAYVEKARPVNVVPHYSLLLNPVTNKSLSAVTVSGNIKTAVRTSWSGVTLLFDNSNNFDNVLNFDWSNTSFLNSVVTAKLGIGNKEVSPDRSDFALSNIVLTYSITKTDVYYDYVRYTLIVPAGVAQAGLSELGLYKSDGTLFAASTFPDIDKPLGIELEIYFDVYFTT